MPPKNNDFRIEVPDWIYGTARSVFEIHGTSLKLRKVLQMETQDRFLWCWAAVAVSISHFYNPSSPWTQCKLVYKLLNANNKLPSGLKSDACCKGSDGGACNQTWHLHEALKETKNFASATSSLIAPAYEDVVAQIKAGRPVGVQFVYINPKTKKIEDAHVAAIDGCFSDGSGGKLLYVHDPLYGISFKDYQFLVSGYPKSNWSWRITYYTKP